MYRLLLYLKYTVGVATGIQRTETAYCSVIGRGGSLFFFSNTFFRKRLSLNKRIWYICEAQRLRYICTEISAGGVATFLNVKDGSNIYSFLFHL